MTGNDDFLRGSCVRACMDSSRTRAVGARMRTLFTWAVMPALCLALGGCEWSDPVPSLMDSPEEPEQAAEPMQVSDGELGLDGQWLIGHGERFSWIATVDGDHATVAAVDGTVVYDGAIATEAIDRTYWRLQAGETQIEALVRGPHEIRAFISGETRAWTVKRASYVPSRFDGAWTIGMGPDELRGGTAYFTSEVWRVIVNETAVREGRIYDLEHRDGVRQIALPVSDTEFATANFMNTPGESLLVWFEGEDGYMVLYRDENAPAWIPTPEPVQVQAGRGDALSE